MPPRFTFDTPRRGQRDAHYSLVLGVLQDDIRHVQTRATAAFAIAAVFVTQIKLGELRALAGWLNCVTIAGIVLLVVAGVAYFHYSQLLNRERLRMAEKLAAESGSWVFDSWRDNFMSGKNTTERPAKRWQGEGSLSIPPLKFYIAAQVCFFFGGIALMAVIVALFLP
jgi:hypothetical protein